MLGRIGSARVRTNVARRIAKRFGAIYKGRAYYGHAPLPISMQRAWIERRHSRVDRWPDLRAALEPILGHYRLWAIASGGTTFGY